MTIIFENNNFQGIFYHLQKQFNINYKSESDYTRYINITASSTGSGRVNDTLTGSYWFSKNEVNSWIKYDFKSNRIILKSYEIQSGWGPKSIRIELSNDDHNWIVVDNRDTSIDFQNRKYIIKHYITQQQLNNEFRYIKLVQGDNGNVDGYHYFFLYRVEFYGNLIISNNIK